MTRLLAFAACLAVAALVSALLPGSPLPARVAGVGVRMLFGGKL